MLPILFLCHLRTALNIYILNPDIAMPILVNADIKEKKCASEREELLVFHNDKQLCPRRYNNLTFGSSKIYSVNI